MNTSPPQQPHPASSPRPAARHSRQSLPVFALYGEGRQPVWRLLHIESIDARSSRYDWEIAPHVHQGLHQVLWLQSGSVRAMLDTAVQSAQGPACVLIPPGVAHAFRFAPHAQGYVLTFDAAAVAEQDHTGSAALQALFTAPSLLALTGVDQDALCRLQSLWDALHAQCQAPQPPQPQANPVPLWLARCVLWQLAQCQQQLRHNQGRSGVAVRHVSYTRWLLLLEEHYREHWPVTRYASALGLSAERLNRLVRAETGLSAQQMLHERLVRQACRQLLHTQAPVSQLAFELGFEDPAYFSRFFRRHTGQAPQAYRQQGAVLRSSSLE